MIFSKANLLAVEVTRADKSIPALDNLHLCVDGSTVAASGACVLAVSPLSDERREKIPLSSTGMFTDETVSADTVREVIKGIPRDTLFAGALEHCDYSGGKFTLTDGKRHRSISARTYPREYIDYRALFARVGKAVVVHREAVNLRRLVDLLEVVDKMFPDSSKNTACYIEFTAEHDVVVRVVDVRGAQRMVAVIKAYDGAEGKWLEQNEWEKNLCGSLSSTGATGGATRAGSGDAAARGKISKKKRTDY